MFQYKPHFATCLWKLYDLLLPKTLKERPTMWPGFTKQLCFLALPFIGVSLSVTGSMAEEDRANIWKDDWAVAQGFSLEIDSTGYRFPSDIEFVPNPGNEPLSPLYYVIELKGALKVVTRNREVYTVADNFLPVPLKEEFQTLGAAGLCLDPLNGFIFISFGYLDKTQVFRNGLVRFQSNPGTFSLEAKDPKFLLDIFANERSDTSHQIGPCVIDGHQLFVPVGYGKERHESQNLASALGSVLRMDLDLEPYADNPFFVDDGQTTSTDFIWSYGHRNIFGLVLAKSRLFATENGGFIDRFLEINRGENYLWEGNDWSFAARANYIFGPAVGLVQLDFLESESNIFPDPYTNKFFIALAGTPGAQGPSMRGQRTVVVFDYDFDNNRAATPPKQLLAYRGNGYQLPVSVQFGPDGLYLVAMMPQNDGTTPILKLSYNPSIGHPHIIEQDTRPTALLSRYGCRDCHQISGMGGNFGPPLDSTLIASIGARINNQNYAKQVALVDTLESAPFVETYDARHNVLASSEKDRLLVWLTHYLQEPAFDNPQSQMPNLGLTPQHAAVVATHLIQINEPKSQQEKAISSLDRLRFFIAYLLPELRYRHILVAFAMGTVATIIFTLSIWMPWSRRSHGRKKQSS
ncbi:MAG: hypothetical protein CMM32_05450 [Rhodospirillaceae bacterium]|nr:hypothetical protein [Rhodospirillaceae bacterium]